MGIDGKWQQIGVDLPSLLPLQAAPQDENQVVPYLQSLHNYLADDRQKVVRALNVLSTFRTLVDEDEDDRPPASGSLAMLTESLTGQMFLDVETSTGVYEWIPLVPEYAAITKEPTGFVNTNEDTTISLTHPIGPWLFNIEPTGDDFTFYVAGTKFVKTEAETIDLTPASTEGNWYIYYNSDGELVLDGTVTSEDVIRDNCFVAELYHNGTSLQSVMDERHGLMPWQTHLWMHLHEGTIHRSGLGLTGLTVDAAGNNDVDAEFDASLGVIIDEDLQHSLAAMTGNWDNMYYSGSAWTFGTTGAESPVELDTGVPQWNSIGAGPATLEDVDANKFFLMHIFASGIILTGTGTAVSGHVAIVGQAQYLTKIAAREGANTEISSIITAGLPMPEFIPVATVIFKRQGSNTYNCSVVSTDTGDDYVSWLGAEIQPGVPPASHALLTNRDDPNQHPADSVATDVSSFGGALSSADDEVQAALDTLDDHNHGGLGDSTEHFYCGYDTTGGTVMSNSGWTPVPLDADIVKGSGYTHSTGTLPAEVTVGATGYYEITYDVTLTNGSLGTARWGTILRLALDGGGGFAEVLGTRFSVDTHYGNNNKGCGTCTVILSLTTGDKVRAEGISNSTGSDVTTYADGCRMTIKRLT